MQRQYNVKSTHWAGNRYTVTDEGGREIYTVRVRGTRTNFYAPGSEEPRFDARSNSFFGWEKKFVETAVDYVFAYFRPKSMGKEGYELLDVARNQIGVLKLGLTREPMVGIEPGPKLKGRAGLKAAMDKMMESTLTRELFVNDKVVARFRIARNRKDVAVTVLNPTVKNIEERMILLLALMSVRTQNNGGG